MFYCDVLY